MRASGLGEFQRHGYFGGVRLAEGAASAVPGGAGAAGASGDRGGAALSSPRVEWVLVAIDERWRRQIKVVWRKRSGVLKEPERYNHGSGNV